MVREFQFIPSTLDVAWQTLHDIITTPSRHSKLMHIDFLSKKKCHLFDRSRLSSPLRKIDINQFPESPFFPPLSAQSKGHQGNPVHPAAVYVVLREEFTSIDTWLGFGRTVPTWPPSNVKLTKTHFYASHVASPVGLLINSSRFAPFHHNFGWISGLPVLRPLLSLGIFISRLPLSSTTRCGTLF